MSRETITRNIRLNMSASDHGLGQSHDMFYSFIDGGSMGDPSDTASFGDDVRSRNPKFRAANSENDVVQD